MQARETDRARLGPRRPRKEVPTEMDSMKSVPRLSSKAPEGGRAAPRGVCRRWLALVGIPVALLAAGEAAGQNEALFRAVEPKAEVRERASSTPLDSLTLRRRLVSINFRQLALPLKTAAVPAAPAGGLRLNLFDDASFTVLVDRTAPTFSGGYSLSGRLADVEMGTATLVVTGDVVVGTVRTPEATYRIRPAGDGLHAVSQIDTARLPPPGEPSPRRRLEEEDERSGPVRAEPPAQR